MSSSSTATTRPAPPSREVAKRLAVICGIETEKGVSNFLKEISAIHLQHRLDIFMRQQELTDKQVRQRFEEIVSLADDLATKLGDQATRFMRTRLRAIEPRTGSISYGAFAVRAISEEAKTCLTAFKRHVETNGQNTWSGEPAARPELHALVLDLTELWCENNRDVQMSPTPSRLLEFIEQSVSALSGRTYSRSSAAKAAATAAKYFTSGEPKKLKIPGRTRAKTLAIRRGNRRIQSAPRQSVGKVR